MGDEDGTGGDANWSALLLFNPLEYFSYKTSHDKTLQDTILKDTILHDKTSQIKTLDNLRRKINETNPYKYINQETLFMPFFIKSDKSDKSVESVESVESDKSDKLKKKLFVALVF